MFNLDNRVTEHNAQGRRVSRFCAAWRAFGNRIHRRGDAEAAHWGWEVTRRPLLSRRYRDPRFRYLAECPACRAVPDEQPCTWCSGTGRIRLMDDGSSEELES
ncbi:MAG: hypothetical protein JWL58_7357 [Streptosporangiaceae bacterium]|jgi:hypothetical protein|nr:hypothetical protein [Streptosporangiaceae bacterium]